MSWVQDKEILQLEANLIDKSIKLTTKDGNFWKVISIFINIVTFGGMKKEQFLNSYATTLGPIQAYPKSFTTESVRKILYHEGKHTKQARNFGLNISPYLGLPIMAIFYLFLPLPLFFAYCRFYLELDAEEYSFRRNVIKHKEDQLKIRELKKEFISFALGLTTGKYGWCASKEFAYYAVHNTIGRVLDEELNDEKN